METPLQMGSFSRQSKTIALFAAPVLALLFIGFFRTRMLTVPELRFPSPMPQRPA